MRPGRDRAFRSASHAAIGVVSVVTACSAGSPPSGPIDLGDESPGEGASSAAAPNAVTSPDHIQPGPPPPLVTFTELPPQRFKPDAPLRLVPIATNIYDLFALAPDAKSWVASAARTPDGKRPLDEGSRLFTPRFPDGVPIAAWVPSAQYTPDGSRVLVWSFGNGALAVVDVASGKTVYEHTAAVCAARWSGPNEIVFHQSSNEADARLYRVDLANGKRTPLGLPRASEYCEANPDGSAWIAYYDARRVYIDGRTGATLPIHPPTGDDVDVALSPGAQRYCIATDQGLTCHRLPDGRLEHVWARATASEMEFAPEGDHALIRYVDNPEGVFAGWAYVDFRAHTVRPLQNFKPTSGSLFKLHPGGSLASIGSSAGLVVYDMGRSKVRVAPHNEMYANDIDRNLPRRVVVGTDGVKDEFYVDVP